MTKPVQIAHKLGDARCPGPSTRDMIMRDNQDVPGHMLEESSQYLGSEDISYERYLSQDFYDREIKHLWPHVWQWACRLEHIPEIGDYITYDVGPYSFIIVRTESGIKAFYNACLHRGTQLRQSESAGNAKEFRCPFHAWTWSLDGDLKHIPCAWDFEHVDLDKMTLPEARTEIWGGFVFINMDPNAPSLEEYIDVLPEHFRDGWDLSKRHIALHVEKELSTNWKAAQEAFLEAYHVLETHYHIVNFVADANAQYDIYGEHVNRFIHCFGNPSPHIPETLSEQAVLEASKMAPDGAKVPDGGTARDVIAQHLRETLGKAWGVDLSQYSNSEMIDSIEYHLFPNMFLFPGIGLPMIYRFRPLDDDKSRTLFEILFLKPNTPGEEIPEAPEPVRIRADQSYKEVPGIDMALAHIYDQDTSNLELQFRGFHASKKRGETLGNYQEARIRRINQIIDRYLTASR